MFDFSESSPVETAEILDHVDEGRYEALAERRRHRPAQAEAGHGTRLVDPDVELASRAKECLEETKFYERISRICCRGEVPCCDAYVSQPGDASDSGCECGEIRIRESDAPLRRKGLPVLWKPDDEDAFEDASVLEVDPECLGEVIEDFDDDEDDDEEPDDDSLDDRAAASCVALGKERIARFRQQFAHPSVAAGMGGGLMADRVVS